MQTKRTGKAANPARLDIWAGSCYYSEYIDLLPLGSISKYF